MLAGRANGKYSPAEVAAWLDGFAAASDAALAESRKQAGAKVNFRRLDEDSRIVNATGRFYAAKLRAALLYEIWLATRDPKAGALALGYYRKGRAAWAAMAEWAKSVYVPDVSMAVSPCGAVIGATGLPASTRISARCRRALAASRGPQR